MDFANVNLVDIEERDNKGVLFDESDDREFLYSIPADLIKENIKTQFSNPAVYRMDYLSSFFQSYEYSLECLESDDELDDLKAVRSEFVSFIEDLFNKKLDIGIPDFYEMGEDEQDEIILYLYRFFIINLLKNFTNFFKNYIKENLDDLVTSLPKRKDITTQAFKKEIDDNDIIIISNLSDIIKKALNTEMTVDEFFKLCSGDKGGTELMYIQSKFDDFTLNGNFIEKYKRMLKYQLILRIECDIRNEVLKKYR